MKSLNDNFFSLKELLDLFAHVLCCFSGEGKCENLGRGDVFFFDHVCDLCSDGRGLACARACQDQLGAPGMLDGFDLAEFQDREGRI